MFSGNPDWFHTWLRDIAWFGRQPIPGTLARIIGSTIN